MDREATTAAATAIYTAIHTGEGDVDIATLVHLETSMLGRDELVGVIAQLAGIIQSQASSPEG